MSPPEPELDVCEVEGQLLEIDHRIEALIHDGMPAVMASCHHDKQVIKHERLFAVFIADGTISPGCNCGMGLYRDDTRFLSHLSFELEGVPLTPLGGTTEQTNVAVIELINPGLTLADGRTVPQSTLYVTRTRAMIDEFRETIRITNFNGFGVKLRVALSFGSDFSDIFEVRGLHRQRHGTFYRPKLVDTALWLAYRGGDGLLRLTRARFDRPPLACDTHLSGHGRIGARLFWELEVPPNGGQATLEFQLEAAEGAPQPASAEPFGAYVRRALTLADPRRLFPTALKSDHAIFNMVLERAQRDLVALTSHYPTGRFIAAGIPWFASPFGRDALVTALQVVWLAPDFAEGVLRFLAQHQGRLLDPYRDESPGKIMHELRFGELARLGLIPHTPYYGTIDATPLWLILLSETYRWTGNKALVAELWGHAEAAMLWLEAYGDRDGDGFFEYLCESPKGIRNQGWKDAFNGVLYPDGTLADGAIAVAEVQGYVYDAKRRMAELCHLMGQEVLAERLTAEAKALYQEFNQRFWSSRHGYYVLALDGEKRQVDTLGSNFGHGLWSGLIPPERVPDAVRQLMAPDMFSGWGIRTLSSGMPAFNPLGYHTGTVWPHDNSIIAKGMADWGYKREANLVFQALFEASLHFPYYRLPELFGGFERQAELPRPSPYPVACSPQAWAAATPLFLLQAALGLQGDAPHEALRVRSPVLPPWLSELQLSDLRVGKTLVDLVFTNDGEATSTRVLNKRGPLNVLIEG